MLSAVVLTKNEEENIRRCVESLLWCDEVVVIDDFSTDRTVEKILNFTPKGSRAFQISNAQSKIKIFKRHLNGDFSAQRNYGLAKASGDWVLFVDADEIISSALASEIKFKVHFSSENASRSKLKVVGYEVKRVDYIFGKELRYGDVGNFYEVRLAKKSAGIWKRKVHEYWDVKGKVGQLKNTLLHYAHPTLDEFAAAIDFYSTLHARQKFEDGERSSVLKILLWPKLKFLKNYFWSLGFLDSTEGFVHAMMMSFHSFLSWSKLWLMSHEPLRK